MSLSDELLGTENKQDTKTSNFSTRRNNTKDNWKDRQKQDRQDIYDCMDRMANVIINDPQKFKEYLDIQSKFPKHSVGNCCVILEKAPYATQIKDKKSWEEKQVTLVENPKSIKILEPTNKDGKIYYNPKEVFDISQTNAEKPQELEYGTRKLLDAVTKDCTAEQRAVDELDDGGKGVKYNENENILYVCKGLTKKALFQGLFQEIAKMDMKDKSHQEFRSYCISYMLCQRYGIDTSDFSFNGVSQEITGEKPKDIRHELEFSRNIFEKMNTRIAEYFEVGGKEKNKVAPER